jgi:hypothetical protein
VARTLVLCLLILVSVPLVIIYVHELLPLHGSKWLRPRAKVSHGKVFVEVRFVLASSPEHYVQIYARLTSNRYLAYLLAVTYRIALGIMYSDLRRSGRFQSFIALRANPTAYPPFWNPNLVPMSLSSKGKMLWRCATVREIAPNDTGEDQQARALRRLRQISRERVSR